MLNSGRKTDIESWLAWAFREELPKAGSGSVGRFGPRLAEPGGWNAIADLGTLIDRQNGYGCIVDHGVEAEPHADALAIGRAVLGLADVWFDPPARYDVLADVVLADGSVPSGAERADAMARGVALAGLDAGRMPGVVIRMAMLQRVPSWRFGGIALERREVRNAQGGAAWFRMVERCEGPGRPLHRVEIDGYDRRRGRPFPGAYRKSVISPDLAPLVAERAEYQAWVMALAGLAASLSCVLGEHIDPPVHSLWPWEAEAGEGAGLRFSTGTKNGESLGNARVGAA